ncbi:hypothetical protein ACFQDN_22350, partial [Pseudomonas asuensis]
MARIGAPSFISLAGTGFNAPLQANPAAAQSTGPKTAHAPSLNVPDRLISNNRAFLVGGFKPSEKKEDRDLLPFLLKPKGEVKETSLDNGGTLLQYQAQKPGKEGEQAQIFNVNVRADSNKQLNHLTSSCISHPGRNGEDGIALRKGFEPLVSHLQNLPAELKLDIAGYTGKNGQGAELALRQTSHQMKDIAGKMLSQRQQFLVKNGQALEDAGYDGDDMSALAERPVVQQ